MEFADTQIPKTTDEVFGRMMHVDITPVITHPERNPLLARADGRPGELGAGRDAWCR